MSSHHFVREGQEPAVFILEGISYQHVAPLLEWVPLIMVVDRALEHVLQWGIKIDVVFRHTYALNEVEEMVGDQLPLQIFSSEKDNLIEKVLEFLARNKFTSVNFISSQPEQIFHFVEKLDTPLQVGIYGETEKWSFVAAGKFEKWMPEGTNVLIKHAPSSRMHTEGVFQTGESWKTRSAGMVRILTNTPFWVGEPL